MTDRDFSIRAGLEASTVTPGNTSPELSRKTPAMEPDCPCARRLAMPGAINTRRTEATNPTRNKRLRCMHRPPGPGIVAQIIAACQPFSSFDHQSLRGVDRVRLGGRIGASTPNPEPDPRTRTEKRELRSVNSEV